MNTKHSATSGEVADQAKTYSADEVIRALQKVFDPSGKKIITFSNKRGERVSLAPSYLKLPQEKRAKKFYETVEVFLLKAASYQRLKDEGFVDIDPEDIDEIKSEEINFPIALVQIAKSETTIHQTQGELERGAEEAYNDKKYLNGSKYIEPTQDLYGNMVRIGMFGRDNLFQEMLRDYDFEKAHRLTSKRSEQASLHDANRNRRIIELIEEGLVPREISPILKNEGFKKVSQDAIEKQIKTMIENYRAHKFLVHKPIDSRLERPDPASLTEALYLNTLQALDKTLTLPERVYNLTKLLSKYVGPGLTAIEFKRSDYVDRMAYCALILHGKAGQLHPQVMRSEDMNLATLKPLFGTSLTSNQWVTNFRGSFAPAEGKVA